MAGRILIWLAILIAIKGRAADVQPAPSILWEDRKVVGVGIGMSEETADAPVSVFGHLFAYILTVDSNGKRWPLDLENAINVAVATGDSPLKAGYHQVPLHRLLHEAMTKEGRSVVLLELKLTPTELETLINELRQRQEHALRYDLIRRNCSFYILNWLCQIRPAMASETRWRTVWTPRQAAELIEANFEVVRRERLTSTTNWAKESTKVSSEPRRTQLADASWCKSSEGALISTGYIRNGSHTSGGFTFGLGQRAFESSPSPVSGPTSLSILEVSHYGALPDSSTRVKVLDFDNLREISGKQGRLSQRLSITWQGLTEADGLRDWIGRYETGLATEITPSLWLSALGGFAICEGGPGPLRPSGSAGVLWLTDDASLQCRYTSTGGRYQGLEASATLRLTQRMQLKAHWTHGESAPSTVSVGLEVRL